MRITPMLSWDFVHVGVGVRLCKATLYSITMYGTDERIVKENPRYPL